MMTMTIPLPTSLTMADSVRNLFKKWLTNVVRHVIVGPEHSTPLPPDQAVDEPTLRPPFLYRNHRFTEPFTALRGQQLTGELSFAQATNLRLEELSSDWTEPERRAFLRRSLQEASGNTPVFDMSDVYYTPMPDTPQVPDFHQVVLVNADFHYAVLPNADFTGAYLKRASFQHAQLPYASFQEAVLLQVDMDGAVLDGANFLQADLRRVYHLERASLEQALYNEHTVFPKGFRPYLRGMCEVVHKSV